jgi:Zn-dependent alcohol dehydrogenase
MRHSRLAALAVPVLLVAAGCTFNTTVHPVKDAPNVPRSDSVAVVTAPPRGAVPLGSVTVRGNRNMVGPACAMEAAAHARRMGATHLIVRPVETPGARGVRCTADAWYLGRVV